MCPRDPDDYGSMPLDAEEDLPTAGFDEEDNVSLTTPDADEDDGLIVADAELDVFEPDTDEDEDA